MTPTQKKQVASLIIRGRATKHIPGLGADDFAVVHAHTIYVVGPNVHGVYNDNRGRCAQFHMPMCAFEQLEYLVLSAEAEDAVKESEERAQPKAA